MRILEHSGHLTQAVQQLLAAVSGVPLPLVRAAQVFGRQGNWLHFPWYSKRSGGGAFVMGERIYVSSNFFDPTRDDGLSLLLLLAHEVGHLPHSARFGPRALGRARFVAWGIGHYLISYARNGKHGHRKARIEQEAERGRWVLRSLITATQKDPFFVVMDNEAGMTAWLARHAPLIDRFHHAYPGW